MDKDIISTKLDDLNLEKSTNENKNEFNNFQKKKFAYNSVQYELGINLYNNMIFFILTSTGKLGSIYLHEIISEETFEFETDEEKNDNSLINNDNIVTLIGDRKDELSLFICNILLSYIVNNLKIKERNNKIVKLMMSICVMKNDIGVDIGVDVNDIDKCIKNNFFKEFILLVKNQIKEMLDV